MANIGRNETCPCGSGKKYKKCCGSADSNVKQHELSRDNPNTTAATQNPAKKPSLFGLPGSKHHIAMVARFSDPNDPRNIGGPEGLPGKYKVTFTLCRPGFSPLPDNEFSAADNLQGDSHLAIAKPAYDWPNLPDADEVVFNATTKEGRFEFIGHPNKEGFLERIEFEPFEATGFRDAERRAYHALTPLMSNISLYLNVPLHIYQIHVAELRTNSRTLNVLAPFRKTPLFKVPIEHLSEEFCKYASLYREAMNSNSPNYQFLCYYKIIEGLRKRRERLTVEAKNRGETIPSRPRYLIPETPREQLEWLTSIFPVPWQWDDSALGMIFPNESLGRKVADVVQEDITLIRHKIAHSVLDDEEPTFSIDQVEDMEEVNKWLPFTKCIARLYIKIEFPDWL